MFAGGHAVAIHEEGERVDGEHGGGQNGGDDVENHVDVVHLQGDVAQVGEDEAEEANNGDVGPTPNPGVSHEARSGDEIGTTTEKKSPF